MSAALKQILQLTCEQENVHPVFRQAVRLAGLEDAITLAKPDYLEAAESILAPMMGALEQRYGKRECASYPLTSEVQAAYERLSRALEAAHEAEVSDRGRF